MQNRLARRSGKLRETCNNPGEGRQWLGFYMGFGLGPGTGFEDQLGLMSGPLPGWDQRSVWREY